MSSFFCFLAYISFEVIIIKTLYIEKMDKPKCLLKKIKIVQDDCKIYMNLDKEKNIKKLVNKLIKLETSNVVLSKELHENKELINAINSCNIRIFDGRWLIKYLIPEILNFVVQKKNIQTEQTEIAVTTNEITDITLETIKSLVKQFRRVTVVTNHTEKLRKLEKEIYEKEGILIIVSNNQKKSLLKPQIILNMDFNQELLNKYKINEEAIIINLEGDIKIKHKRFNGININDYEIDVGREEIIWRENMKSFKAKDLLEAKLYMKDTFYNIRTKIIRCCPHFC